MYACIYGHHLYSSRVWINRVRWPILLVVSWTGKMNIFSLSPFVPENLFARDRFGRPVPRQPAHSPHLTGWIWNNVYIHHMSQIGHQSVWLCQSCSWSAEQRRRLFRAWYSGLVKQVRPFRLASAGSFSTSKLNLVRPMAFTGKSLPVQRASNPQGCSSNRCCIFRKTNRAIFVHPFEIQNTTVLRL